MSGKPEENEQWLTNGNCHLCRRKNWCQKPCTRCNRRHQARMQALTAGMLDQMTGGAMREIIQKRYL